MSLLDHLPKGELAGSFAAQPTPCTLQERPEEELWFERLPWEQRVGGEQPADHATDSGRTESEVTSHFVQGLIQICDDIFGILDSK